jgi:MFS transporter, DHA1 family, multidrug resistance protein
MNVYGRTIMDQRKKMFILFAIGAMSTIAPFSIDMYLPGLPSIARDLHADMAQVNYTLTAYFMGLSLGLLLYGPLLDRYGRKKPILIGLLLYVVAAIGCALAPSIMILILFRFFLALGCCVGMVGSSTIVRDLFKGNEVAKAMSIMMTIFGVAPIIAPSIGGIIITGLGWRYVFVTLALFAFMVIAAIRVALKDARGPDTSVSLRLKDVAIGYGEALKTKQFLFYILTIACSTCGLFTYITGSPFVFMNLFGFTASQYALIFGANGLAMVIGSQINRMMLKKMDSRRILPVVLAIQSTFTASLAVCTIFSVLPRFGMLAFVMIHILLLGLINPNAAALALFPFARNVGTASACLGSFQMGSGILASWLLGMLHNGTGIPMVATMACCSILALVFLLVAQKVVKTPQRACKDAEGVLT